MARVCSGQKADHGAKPSFLLAVNKQGALSPANVEGCEGPRVSGNRVISRRNILTQKSSLAGTQDATAEGCRPAVDIRIKGRTFQHAHGGPEV